jgi:hypothetical protein
MPTLKVCNSSFHPFTLHPVTHHVVYAVYPAHIAFVLLNEGAGDEPSPGSTSFTQVPLFSSVIQKAGGDVVSTPYPLCYLTHQMPDPRKTRIAAHRYSPSCTIPTTR